MINNINTVEYWENRFKSKDWQKFDGENQTKFFATLMIDNIPQDIKIDIKNNKYSILDFGCACGQLCNEIKESFPNSEITGIDFSSEAINRAKELYPNVNFRVNPLDKNIDKFDVICCSNVLEHLLDWENYLTTFTQVSQKYIIILVPYLSEIFGEHVVSFDLCDFKDNINGFNQVYHKIMDTNNSGYWNGKQLLVVYEKNL